MEAYLELNMIILEMGWNWIDRLLEPFVPLEFQSVFCPLINLKVESSSDPPRSNAFNVPWVPSPTGFSPDFGPATRRLEQLRRLRWLLGWLQVSQIRSVISWRPPAGPELRGRADHRSEVGLRSSTAREDRKAVMPVPFACSLSNVPKVLFHTKRPNRPSSGRVACGFRRRLRALPWPCYLHLQRATEARRMRRTWESESLKTFVSNFDWMP